MDIDEPLKPKSVHVLGEVLDSVSVDELKLRVAALQAEINRLESEIDRKQASKRAADAFFKS